MISNELIIFVAKVFCLNVLLPLEHILTNSQKEGRGVGVGGMG